MLFKKSLNSPILMWTFVLKKILMGVWLKTVELFIHSKSADIYVSIYYRYIEHLKKFTNENNNLFTAIKAPTKLKNSTHLIYIQVGYKKFGEAVEILSYSNLNWRALTYEAAMHKLRSILLNNCQSLCCYWLLLQIWWLVLLCLISLNFILD